MPNRILVITCSVDVHADFLCQKIEKMGVQTFRFDTDKLDKYEIDFRISPDLFAIRDKKTGNKISNDEIGSVWYRRPTKDVTSDKLFDEEVIRFIRGETKEWIKSITLALKNSFWVVAPWVLYEARIKTNQLSVAQKIGLNVPKTLVTRNRSLIKEFFHKCPNGIIAKTLKIQYTESENNYSTLSTQEIQRKDLTDRSLCLSPCIFQEKITTSHELRIVIIGRKVFAFKVLPKIKRGILDIRANGLDNIEYVPCSIPIRLKQKIFQLLDHFGLPFSSMDFLIDLSGKEYFTDLNPNGQWLWLELQTGIVMSDLFAEMLIKKKIPV